MTQVVSVSSAPSASTATDLWTAARQAADGGRWLVSRDLARRALRRWAVDAPHDQDLRIRILIALAYNESELGRRQRAHNYLDRAAHPDGTMGPAVQVARAMILVRNGRPNDAVADFDAAIRQLRVADSGKAVEDLGGALVNRGLLHMTAGRLVPAEADTREALCIGERLSLTDLVSIAQHNLGFLQYLKGDLPAALATMKPAGILESGSDGVALLDRSRVLTAAGLLGEATDLLDDALRTLENDGATADLIDALLLHADLDLRRQHPQEAVVHAEQAAALARRRGNKPAALVADLIRLRAGRHKDPRHCGLDPVAAARLAPQLEAAGLVEEGRGARVLQAEWLLAQGQVRRAVRILQALPGPSQLLAGRLHERLLDARVAVADGDRRRGLVSIRQGMDELARFQATFGSQDLQAAVPVHGTELAALGVQLALESGSPAQVLQWLERSRGVTTRMPQVRPVADAELAADLGALRSAWNQARAAVLAGGVDRSLEAQVRELRRRIRSRMWARTAHRGAVVRPPSLAQVRRRLAAWASGPAPVVVAGFRAGDDLHVLVVSERRAQVRPLTTVPLLAELSARVGADLDLLATSRIPPLLRQVARRSLDDGLARLDEVLLRPIADLIGEDPDVPLLLSGVGTLATVPWSLLPRLRGRPLTVNSSVTAGLQPLVRSDGPILAVTGPGPALAEKEAAAVARCHPGSAILPDATGAELLAALPGVGLLHVAAHGRHEVQSPMFSHVLLADGPVHAYDLAMVPLPPQVVLSACEVGRSDARVGEPLGLAAALLRTGVSTVVAGVSRIADDVAADVMVDYHRRLAAGETPAVALAGAVAASPEPAAFTCFGAGL